MKQQRSKTNRLSWALAACSASLLVAGAALAKPDLGKELRKQRHLFELGVFAGAHFPAADKHELFAFPDVGHRPLKSLGFEGGLRLAYLPLPYVGAELEAGFVPTSTKDDKSALLYALRAHVIAQYPARVTPFILAGFGGLGVASKNTSLGGDIDAMFHWGLGAKIFATKRLSIRIEGRHSIGPQLGPEGSASHFELLAGIGYLLGVKDEPDSDGDGIIDAKDKCPKIAAKTEDGCPPDSDGDGVRDDKDACPKKFGKRKNGCPAPDSDKDGLDDDEDKCPKIFAKTKDGCPGDSDGDGLTDDKDKCPKQPAKTPDGCPPKDSDGDGITDDKDKCPNQPETKNGYQDDDGCPDVVPKAVKKFTGAIRGITFAFGSAKIRARSFRTLKAAVKVLKDYPAVKLLIRGHSDNRGKADFNQKLSERRAESVRQYLIKQGIAEDRLRSEGVGMGEPVASNKTAAGRAKNRRIEFKLVTR